MSTHHQEVSCIVCLYLHVASRALALPMFHSLQVDLAASLNLSSSSCLSSPLSTDCTDFLVAK